MSAVIRREKTDSDTSEGVSIEFFGDHNNIFQSPLK